MRTINIVQKQINDLTNQIEKTEESDLYFKRGELYKQSEEIHLAFSDFFSAFINTVEPDIISGCLSHLLIIMDSVEESQFDDFNQIFKKLHLIYKNHPLLYFLNAKFFENSKEFRKATVQFKKAIEYDEFNILFRTEFIEYYINQEKYSKAIELANQYLKEFPDNSSILISRANAYFYSNKFNEAITDLAYVIENEPDNLLALHRLSGIHHELDEIDEALNLINKCMDLDAENTTKYLIERSMIHQDDENIEQALKDLDDVIKSEPDNSTAYFHRAEIYFSNQYDDKALDDLNKAIELNPNMPQYYLIRGMINQATGNMEQGMQDILKVSELGGLDNLIIEEE